ncbi:CusA/CzcA family heavy metal efflux RND transporter [Lacinutrix sp. C3R15]|uniref:CusA/CzcA family heavy metal efflux RND transporter n=1 Tax=Flavobacteriaceae TaxID=49546 RepID=UPI001C08DF0D|nr:MULTISPECIES: CusA/CzcA family heavy metal efflux RND transporter [Flavobacteriaceae]MBU2940831.1 CusA/CzcA family heavy metal efflux RND transporter [Lacinutrix sp. C3R15]MDO6624149.1 CusA/CzcA family heavy metal efflux RND transporter [Oceanihabitans sp. 1_MG-2023]
MLTNIIKFSLNNKLIVFLFTAFILGFGIFSLSQIPIGAVPDITNNQVQVITTSRNLSTQDVEQFITYPVELEMANLPGVEEIRSVSKFGLSVVTIVFNDDLGTYLPRQLIAEKIKSASEQIPEGFGAPEMGPITTGLGEIYQYILDVKPGYDDQYSTTDLRTIQDWIVKRQLSGIPGVVEINTWGGFLKQYEVAINPNKLTAMHISIAEIYDALEKNNSVTGGGYIEKNNKAFFIRGEGLVSSLQDIENIVVKNDGTPIYIKDVANVGFGSATRFGAITGNGEGEKVLGQIMMLKNGNSKEVIDTVKERVAQIQSTLPEGVYINGFLERSELINKTTFTVAENLILGSLIVIFVVVLLLGNWRSGLVVASVIPLSLLFAIILMNYFGVDANLMSLGAIDFGIIIDGAVIIVEFIAFQIMSKTKHLAEISKKEKQAEIDQITLKSASKMMNSAIFGQLIILIVFIPILSLSGIEGKMFRPMAMTFSFALIGAMILCLTYVPVVSSLFLKPNKQSAKNISVRLMQFLNKGYQPIINWALNNKKIVIVLSAILLTSSIWIFSKMGGEFVPTLDEGDFVIQPVLKTGTSLGKTIEITTRIEQILLDNFPEVDQVVTRIGAAEVPTDPMSMEESDVIIKLIPKKQWTSANSKDELADKFKEALKVIPGMEVEFTQPIEMRFNELVTGVRADVAIKIFGEDLTILATKADQIKNLIKNVEGAADISVEKVEGLPQMSVTFNRSKIARYGLNIKEVNRIISMGFAGATVGNVFEGEKRFDLVLRLQQNSRKNLESLQNLFVDTPNGNKIPLSELAEIKYTNGPAQISRDDTKRRIVVGINVRNRDLQSVVQDIQNILESKLKLPTGYNITYGGQFENLQSAKDRLLIAVPVALLLIFILLYFAFHSVKEALIVYSAIPLSAVGGILLLWLRGLPFSISAGVGFIALFGIAVLNGIVLIEHFKELKERGFSNINERIKKGTSERLRPVLLTAAAAALGFLPMAVSTNAGAEVQRPLATVVIGGLVTATLLTLVVLPILYAWFEEKKELKMKKKNIVTVLVLLLTFQIQAQNKPLTIEQTLALAIENNASLKAENLKTNQENALVNSAFSFDKTNIYYNYDESNLAINNKPLKVFGVSQDFKFPTVYFAQKKQNLSKLGMQKASYSMQLQQVKKLVYVNYYQLSYAKNKVKNYKYLDSLYQDFVVKAERRFELGETNYLEMITARSKQKQLETLYKQSLLEVNLSREQLKKVVQIDSIAIADDLLKKLEVENISVNQNAGLSLFDASINYQKAQTTLEKQNLLPDINATYFQGTNNGLNKNLTGYQLGLKIPILFGAQRSKIKAAKIAQEVVLTQKQDYKTQLHAEQQSLFAKLQQYEEAIQYYKTQGQTLSEEIIKTANRTFKEGEIDFFQYIQSVETAKDIQLNYLEQLNNYNQTVININYLIL